MKQTVQPQEKKMPLFGKKKKTSEQHSILRSQTLAGGSREPGYARLVHVIVIYLCRPQVRGTFPLHHHTTKEPSALGQLSHVIIAHTPVTEHKETVSVVLLRVHRGHALSSSFHSSGCYDGNSHTIRPLQMRP